MYGDGLTWRSTRYTSNGSKCPSRSKRCASTTWKMSPARMCSRADLDRGVVRARAHRRRELRQLVEVARGWRRRHVRQRSRELVDPRRRARARVVVRVDAAATSLDVGIEEHVLDEVEALAEVVERGDVPGDREHRVGHARGRRAARRAGARSRARRRSRGSRRRHRGTAAARRACGARYAAQQRLERYERAAVGGHARRRRAVEARPALPRTTMRERRVAAEEREPSPALGVLDRLEQEAGRVVLTGAHELHEGGDRRLEVGQHLAPHRHDRVVTGERDELVAATAG